MVKQQLFIGAALLAGAAIGYCVAPREPLAAAPAETDQVKASAPIPDGGAEASIKVLRERIKSLERELSSLRSADNAAAAEPEQVESGRDETRVEGPAQGRERFRAEMERLKQEEPERYRQIVQRMEGFRKMREERQKAKLDFLSSVDVSGMGSEAKKVHEGLKELIARRREVETEFADENLADERREELMGEMREIDRAMRAFNAAERTNLLGEVAKAVGLEGAAATELVESVKDIVEATEGSRPPHGPPPGPPLGAPLRLFACAIARSYLPGITRFLL